MMTGHNVEIDPVKYGALWGQVQSMEKNIETLEKNIEKIEQKVDQLLGLANRSKGALWVVMAIVGSVTTVIIAIIDFLKGH